MVNFYLSPKWFSGYDIILELVFAIILLTISIFAFNIYKKTKKDSVKILGISFSLMSLSYFIQSIFNLLMILQINSSLPRGINLKLISSINQLALNSHILFMTLGLILLSYMTLKTKNRKIFIYLAIIITFSILLITTNRLFVFYILSSIFLLYIQIHFIRNYLKFKNLNALLILLAFLFLFLSNIIFTFSLYRKIFYFWAHIALLISYLLILLNFYTIRKNVKKKRKA
jgi:hypothetical protein